MFSYYILVSLYDSRNIPQRECSGNGDRTIHQQDLEGKQFVNKTLLAKQFANKTLLTKQFVNKTLLAKQLPNKTLLAK